MELENNKGVSVIVCCYNSAVRLPETIKHIALQQFQKDVKWELVIVNNNSTDNTVDVAIEEINKYNSLSSRYQIISEHTPGLSFARSTGIKMSNYEYAIFCDDDNWLDKYYVQTAFDLFEDDNISLIGGLGKPVFEKKEPPFFWKNQHQCLAVGPQGDVDGQISEERGYIYGAGMCIRKAHWIKVFDKTVHFKSSDRIGDSLISGGDNEICYLFKQQGYRIHYASQLTFCHYIPEFRTQIKYYRKLFKGFGQTEYKHLPYKMPTSFNGKHKSLSYIWLQRLKNLKIYNLGYLVNILFNQQRYRYVEYDYQLYTFLGFSKEFFNYKNYFKTIGK